MLVTWCVYKISKFVSYVLLVLITCWSHVGHMVCVQDKKICFLFTSGVDHMLVTCWSHGVCTRQANLFSYLLLVLITCRSHVGHMVCIQDKQICFLFMRLTTRQLFESFVKCMSCRNCIDSVII